MRLRHRNLKIVSIWVTLLFLALAGVGWWFYSNRDARAYEMAAEAEMALRMGRLDEARTGLWEAISRKDDVPEFYLLLGRTNIQAGEPAAAFSAFNTAYSLDPDNIEAMLAVAQIGVQMGEIEASKEATRRILLRDPNFPQAILVQGIHSMLSRDYDEAIASADQVLQRDPSSQEALILKIRALFLDDQIDEVQKLLAEHASPVSNNTGMAMTELEVYRELSQADKMLEAFDKLRILLPDNLDLRLDEAHLRYKLGDAAKANDIAIAVLSREAVQPEAVSSALRLMRLYADPKDIARYVPRIQGKATNDARFELAKYLEGQGELAAGRALMKGITGVDAQIFQALADIRIGRSDEALSIANSILEDDNSHCYAQFLKSRAQLANGSPRAAVRSGQTAMNECPSLFEGWSVLAQAFDKAGDDLQAERVFEQGIEFNPQEPTLSADFSNWLIGKERPREAIAVARKIARLMPAYSPAWEAYLSLCRQQNSGCVKQAQEGLERSRTIFGLDPPPGERATVGLFGRFLIR